MSDFLGLPDRAEFLVECERERLRALVMWPDTPRKTTQRLAAHLAISTEDER